MTVELAIATPVFIAGFGVLLALINIGSAQGSARLQVEAAAEQLAHGRDTESVLGPLKSLGAPRAWNEQGHSCVGVRATHRVLGLVGFNIPISLTACATQTPVTN